MNEPQAQAPPGPATPRVVEARAPHAVGPNKGRAVPWSHLAFWITALFLCLLSNHFVRSSFSGFGKRPLDVNGKLLCLAVVASVAFWVITLSYLFKRREASILVNGWFRGALSATVILFPICLVIAALRPAALPPDQDYIFVPPQQPVEQKFGTTFLYPNGRDTLLPSEVWRLADDLEVLHRCNVTNMEVRGYASSAKYRSANEGRNLKLANDRADALSKQLGRKGIQTVPHHWRTFFEMTNDRRIRDVDSSGKRITEKERLNRRVEVWWIEGTDCVEQATK